VGNKSKIATTSDNKINIKKLHVIRNTTKALNIALFPFIIQLFNSTSQLYTRAGLDVKMRENVAQSRFARFRREIFTMSINFVVISVIKVVT